MKKTSVLRSLLCILLLLAVMAAATFGMARVTAPIAEESARRAAERAAEAEKALLGNAELLYDRADPASSALTVSADAVQTVYRNADKETYILRLSTNEGYTGEPIELTLTVGFDGKIVSLTVDRSSETKELSEDFLPSFEGQDSALAGVQLVAGVTYSSSAIRNAVNDGMNAMVEAGLFAAGEKSAEQLLAELIPTVYPGLVNASGVIQGEELEGSGSLGRGYKASNGSGCAWFVRSGDADLLAVVTGLGGVRVYDAEGTDLTDSADPALLDECRAQSEFSADLSAKQLSALTKMLPEGAEPVPVEIPGLSNSVTYACAAETEDGTLYAFAVRPYGYSNEVMELYYVLDENGAIVSMRATELILFKEYFTDYQLDEPSYKEGFTGLTADSYTGDQALITGATVSTGAVDTATRDVFEAFALLTK